MFDTSIEKLRAQIMADSLDREVGERLITVLQAVQQHVYCPHCDSLLDDRRTVVIERDTRAIGVSCDKCYMEKMRRIAQACAGRDRKYVESMQAGLTAARWNERSFFAADVMWLMQ